MRDLFTNPLWKEEDLGKPIPDSPHAVSVALPRWEHVIGYEEKDPAIVERMSCGYPRFYCHPLTRELFARAAEAFAEPGEEGIVLRSEGSARRCVIYLRQRAGVESRVEAFGGADLWAVVFPGAARETALKYWQHCGEIPSSRLCAVELSKAGAQLPGTGEGREARDTLRSRIAGLSGQRAEDVFLFPSGMAGVAAVHRALNRMFPGRKCVQLEFPYVDVLKVQQQFGPGVHFLPLDESGDLAPLEKLLENEQVAGVYCELASNPLLRCVDLERLGGILRRYEVPLVADDTIGTVVNIDAFRAADVVTTSLTKYFSGVGDVLAGSVALRADSAFRQALRVELREVAEDALWDGDAIVLEGNSRDFEERVRRMNASGEALYEFLAPHRKVQEVWYPKNRTRDFFDAIRRPGGGYGALISILLRDASRSAPAFYDALRVSKGPSLGTNYSLACPYTLLAHYGELDWAEDCGVARNLVRISTGMEEVEDLVGRFEQALAAV
ncbi:MAG: PLP-dependent transferase [Verrucomicrobiales bacterium]